MSSTSSASFQAGLRKLKKWEKMAKTAPELLPIIAKNSAEETVGMIQSNMKRGQDPYGNNFEPLKFRTGTPLSDRGQMRAAWFRKSHNANGFSVANGTRRSKFHNEGTGLYGPRKQRIYPTSAKALRIPVKGGAVFARSVKGVPKRRMTPENGKLPQKWRRAYREISNDVFLSHFTSK